MIRVTALALALPLVMLPAVTFATDDDPLMSTVSVDTSAEKASAYWQRNREGWFWYRAPPEPISRGKEAHVPPPRPRELADFEAMQKTLEDLKRVAVMNPTDTNLLAYMRYQRFIMDKSERFAERWQRLVWSVPELDYGLTGRPTNAMAIGVFDEQQRDRHAQTVRNLAATHGLLFIYRSDCPYCHRLAPILKRFEQEFGMTVFAVSLDGRAIAEYPNALPDNGMAARLNTSVVPALYLTQPAHREIRPIGFGMMALNELVDRIAVIARGSSEKPL